MRRFIVFLSLVSVIMSACPITAKPLRVVAYFPEWGIEHQPYYVKDIEKYGAADKLTVLMYAFSEPSPDSSGEIEPKFMSAYEAYQQVYTAAMSVDGVADDSTQALRGEFNQMKELKARHPNLKILISVGGWTGSGYFSDALATASSREKFADAIINRYIKGSLPRWGSAGGEGVAAGIFDGVDIDWEYPISDGNSGNHHNPADAQNLTAFYALMRAKLDSIDPHLILTAAVPATDFLLGNYQIRQDEKYLNWYNLMTYDFTGAWAPTTGFHAELFAPTDDPSMNSFDKAVRYFLDSLHVECSKIVPGVAFYGRGWKGVGPKDNGLYQPADGAAPGDYEAGINNYSSLMPLTVKDYTYHWDRVTMAPWLYSPTLRIFWSIDDAKSIALKYHYVNAYHLGGIMCWDISGDDSVGTLVTAMSSGRMPEAPVVRGESREGKRAFALKTAPISEPVRTGSNVIIHAGITASDSSIKKLEFFVDGKSIGSDTKAPFDWVWFNATAGRHVVKAVASNADGTRFSSEALSIDVKSNP